MAELTPPTLHELGFEATLRWWAGQVRERYGLDVKIDVTGEMPRLDRNVEAMLFQVAKELLKNGRSFGERAMRSRQAGG